MLFHGFNSVSLDAKGRLAIPTRHRDVIMDSCQGQLIVTMGDDNKCLAIYPIDVFQDIQRRLVNMSGLNKQVKDLKRKLIGHAASVSLDSNGRILVPNDLRKTIHLDKKAVVVGQINKLELWEEDARHRWGEDTMTGDVEDQEINEQLAQLPV